MPKYSQHALIWRECLDEVDMYGVDDPEASVRVETVTVPESVLTVLDAVLQELTQRVNPLAASDNYAIDMYQDAVDILII